MNEARVSEAKRERRSSKKREQCVGFTDHYSAPESSRQFGILIGDQYKVGDSSGPTRADVTARLQGVLTHVAFKPPPFGSP